MPWPNFCSACGAPATKAPSDFKSQLRIWLSGSVCPECRAWQRGRIWHPWLIGAAGGFLCGLAVFLWRASVPPPPSLPVLTTFARQESAAPSHRTAEAKPSENSGDTAQVGGDSFHLCGAPTRSGRPCRRKVHGTTGYCWQHQKKG